MKSQMKIIALMLFVCSGCGDNEASRLEKLRNPSNLVEFYDSITCGELNDINGGDYDEEMPDIFTCSDAELSNAVMRSSESVNKVRSICDKLLDSSKRINGSEMDRSRIVYVISSTIKSIESKHEKNKMLIPFFYFLRKNGITREMIDDWITKDYPLFLDMKKQFEFESMLSDCGIDPYSL